MHVIKKIYTMGIWSCITLCYNIKAFLSQQLLYFCLKNFKQYNSILIIAKLYLILIILGLYGITSGFSD